MLQSHPELMPGAVDVGFDGSKREVEGGGDLLVRSVLYMTKQDAGPVLRSQLRDRLLDGSPHAATAAEKEATSFDVSARGESPLDEIESR
ncbi:MAG TPA: hypothetical protein VIQ60_02090, partial [Gemmatimonadaceae bacterium]